MDIKEKQIHLLASCINSSMDSGEFRWDKFFQSWFRDSGNPYFFLFKKNLGVTNMQFVELFELMTQYSENVTRPNKECKLLFYSTDHIKMTFSETIASLLDGYDSNDKSRLLKFAEKYLDIFSSTVAVDMFFGSCAIFTSQCIETDLDQVVFSSGYIHSAGRSIFIRNIRKTKKNDFYNALDSFLLKAHDTTAEIPFIIYSHEDFSGYDRETSYLIEKGIEQCKIYVEKMSMGSQRLPTILKEMQTSSRYKGKLHIPEAGSYLVQHSFKSQKTIWLISDRSISSGQIKNPGLGRYYICYEQAIKNDSPFFFDENKPAWKSHTTLPHSLTAALLNATGPVSTKKVICDPFGGTGTTWMEAKRLKLKCKVYSSDLSPATKLLITDNVHFFTMPTHELELLLNNIQQSLPSKIGVNQYQIDFFGNKVIQEPYGKMLQLIKTLKDKQPDEEQEFHFTDEFVENLGKLPFLTRIIFYIGLRAELRFQSSFKRKSLNFETAFKKSMDSLLDQIELFLELRKEVESDFEAKKSGPFYKSIAKYSYKLTPSIVFNEPNILLKNIDSEIHSSLDATKLAKNSFDIIICDPPYGFNTDEDEESLVELYSNFIDKAILSLKSGGQLILCLPAESYTGKDLPYCTRSDIISRQVLTKAHLQGRTVFKPAKSVPIPSLSPPYYWESDRALRRTILHFYFW